MSEWLIAFENMERSSTRGWLQEPEQEDFSQVKRSSIRGWLQESEQDDFSQAKNRAPGWSITQDKISWQPLQDVFKLPSSVSRIFVFLLIIFFIDSCVNAK